MKALSLLQPWATAVVQGHKSWETRSFKTNYRGKLLIHASKKWTKAQDILLRTDPFNKFLKPPYSFPVGMIIGSVDLVDCIPTEDWFEMTIREKWNTTQMLDNKGFGNFDAGRFAWHLQNPVEFKHPVPAPGALGIWNFQQCRECGCSWFDPCINEKAGCSCSWAEPDLCSFCAEKEDSTILRNFPTFISKPNHILKKNIFLNLFLIYHLES